MNVSDIGEFALIERLRRALPVARDARIVLGIGDDAAVWRSEGAPIIATTDTMVAGVHFLTEGADWRAVGWKALAVNVSDVAAMGGAPAFALVTLCLPADTLLAALDELYQGLAECAQAYGVSIVGGDIVRAPIFSITVALAGEAAAAADGSPAILRRDAARAGDAIAVTGSLGGSAGGLRSIRAGSSGPETSALIARHRRPHPRVDAGRAAVDAGARCAIDVSDGFAQDLDHICVASGVAAKVSLTSLPVDPALLAVFPEDAPMMAASGGEDYELIIVAPEDVIERTSASLDAPLAVVGRVIEQYSGAAVTFVGPDGGDLSMSSRGWDHFASPATRG